MTFTDDHTVLLSWNQQQPRNVVVQTSTDGGLTYSPITSVAAPDPEFPGPMRYITSSNIVYMPWTKGEQVNLAVSHDGGDDVDATARSRPATPSRAGRGLRGRRPRLGRQRLRRRGRTRPTTTRGSASSPRRSSQRATSRSDAVAATDDGEPTVESAPRRRCRSTATPCARPSSRGSPPAARRAASPSRSTARRRRRPELGRLQRRLERLRQPVAERARRDAHVQPGAGDDASVHYDSICLNGLGCDLAVPPGDRTLADFFAIGYDPSSGRLSVVYDRDNKKPDEDARPRRDADGRDADRRPVEQRHHGRGREPRGRPHSSTDPTGDAQSSYSLTAPGRCAADAADEERAGGGLHQRRRSGLTQRSGGFTVTLKVANLSTTALTQALTDTGRPVARSGSGASRTATRTRPRASAGTRCRASRSAGTTTRSAASPCFGATKPRARARSASSTRATSRSPARSTS